jgi:hypothetical protein
MGKSNNPPALRWWAEAVAALAARLDPAEAAAAARLAVEAMGKTNDPTALFGLARAVAALAPRLDPEEAARQSAAVARGAVEAMGKTNDPHALTWLAEAVAALAARLDPEEAARQSAAAARRAAEAMGKTNDRYALGGLAVVAAALAPRLEPAEAARLSAAAARRAVEAMGKVMGKTIHPGDGSGLGVVMAVLLARAGPEETSPRVDALAVAVASMGDPTAGFAALAPLAEASRPLPGRFSEQQLVDLLKMPTCPQPARQAIVEQLGRQCGRPFADQWEFVEWARAHRPDLDLTSPPVRPTAP